MDIKERVIKILTDIYGSDYNVEDETVIINESGIDSAEIVMALEEEFVIEIPDEDAEKLSTLKNVIEYLTEKIKKEK